MLADLAVRDEAAFATLVHVARDALGSAAPGAPSGAAAEKVAAEA